MDDGEQALPSRGRGASEARSAAKFVAAKLRELIDDRTYKYGERLPSESELAQQMQVRRSSVRTALQQLDEEGLLKPRPGQGWFVKRPPQLTPAGPLLVSQGGYEVEAIHASVATGSLIIGDERPVLSEPVRVYRDNEQYWNDLLGERARGRLRIKLTDFYLMEWLPRSPGLFHTEGSADLRNIAFRELYPLTDTEREFYLGTNPESPEVYTVRGKQGMLDAGLGCFRLKDKYTSDGRLWFLGATSSLIAHEGLVVALTNSEYERVIDDVIEHGALRCTITGRLSFIPDNLSRMYGTYASVPMLYVHVDRIEPAAGSSGRPDRQPLASGAVTFKRSGEDRFDREFESAYIEFTAGRGGSLRRRLPWLAYYVEEMHNGVILADFDEQMRRYAGAAFSLIKVSGGMLDRAEMNAALGAGEGVYIDRLMVMQGNLNVFKSQIARVTMGDTFNNIGAGATIINRSSLQNAAIQLRDRSGQELASALEQVAYHVEQSANADAAENLAGLTEELERSEPRRARLQAFWGSLTSILPSVAQLGEASAKLAELVASS